METPAILQEQTVTTPIPGFSRNRVAQVVREMQCAWQDRKGPPVEYFLEEHPQIARFPEAVLRLIHEEIGLRRQRGEEPASEELLQRFPQWESFLCQVFLDPAQPRFAEPRPNDVFGNFLLLEQLGEGAEGSVYLAQQLDLGNRPVVLKITQAKGAEHLSLARLQHTSIVPLFGVVEDGDHQLRALCMPYFGRATLKQLLEGVAAIPQSRRQGKDLLAELDRIDSVQGSGHESTARTFLRRASYIQGVCWIGAALADGLQYAHERGLVHLDVKPSNVLLSGDGQPMLLDFHLARPPLQAGEAPPQAFGGTPSYMAPEQQAVFDAVQARRPIALPVDARTDIFSLGMILYEALGGDTSQPPRHDLPNLRKVNPLVSVGLADIVHKCLAWNSADRYASAAALAEDLRCHVHDLPLRGVKNRSWQESWSKWRRRRPSALPVCVLVVALIGALAGTAYMTIDQAHKRRQLAEEFFNKGRSLLQQQQFSAARENLSRGLELVRESGGNLALARALEEHARLADRAGQANKLHQLAESLRHVMLFPTDDQRTLIVLDVGCRQVWDQRPLLLSDTPPLLEPLLEQRLRRDLVDLAVGWAELRVRLAPPKKLAERRLEASALLTEASCWAHLPELEWRRYQSASPAQAPGSARSGWEFYLSGRSLFRAAQYADALAELERGVRLDPADFHGNFCLGVCAARLGRHDQAIAAFSVCVGQNPLRFEPFLQRGRVYALTREWHKARADFDRAWLIRPNDPDLALERARVCIELGERELAEKDLTLVLELQPRRPDALQLLQKIRATK